MSYIFGDYRVTWTYNSVNKETTCEILNKHNEQVAKETIKLYHTDEYDRKAARKASFKKVMDTIVTEGTLSKHDRSILWLYFNTFIKDYN